MRVTPKLFHHQDRDGLLQVPDGPVQRLLELLHGDRPGVEAPLRKGSSRAGQLEEGGAAPVRRARVDAGVDGEELQAEPLFQNKVWLRQFVVTES